MNAQRDFGCFTFATVQCQVGQGSKQPGLVAGQLELDDL